MEENARFVFASPIAGGCPILNAAIEVDDYRTHMRKAVAKEASEILQSLTNLLEEGVAVGEFKKDLKCKEIATILFCNIEGALMMARLERSDEAMKFVVQHGKNIINQYTHK